MRRLKEKILAPVLVILLSFTLVFLGGCFQKNSNDSSENQSVDYGNTNPLTGLPMDESKTSLRPVCIMTNNMKKAD